MLGDRIRRRTQLREQPGGGNRLQQIAFAPRQHVRQHRARRVHVRHHVHFPTARPLLVRRLDSPLRPYAGVGTEQVNDPEFLDHLLHQPRHIGLAGHVGDDGLASDFICHLLRGRALNVGDHYRTRAFRGEAPAQGAPDPVCAARYHYDFASQLHVAPRPLSDLAAKFSGRSLPVRFGNLSPSSRPVYYYTIPRRIAVTTSRQF